MKVTVSYEFASQNEFAQHFGISFPSVADKPKDVEPVVQHAEHKPAAAVETKPVEQPASAAALAGKTATFEDCAKSYQAHVQRGQGRSAMTARAAIIRAIPHYTSFKALTPEECATAVDVMDAA